MQYDEGKYWLNKEEIRQVAAHIWRTYHLNAESDLEQIKREILPQYTKEWANIHKTQLADLIGLGIHNLREAAKNNKTEKED